MATRNPRGTFGHASHRALGLGGLIVAGFASTGCYNNRREQSDAQLFTWTGELKAPGWVRLRNLNGAVEVKQSADDSVRVTAGATWHRGNPGKDLEFRVVPDAGGLTVCVLWNRGSCPSSENSSRPDFLRNFLRRRGTDANVTLTVYVPARVRVDARTSNGDVRVEATAPVTARTINGSIRVATAVGPVTAETINGSVDVRMTTLGEEGPVRAVTVNGTASAYLPESFDATVSLSAVNGGVATDFPLSADSVGTSPRHLRGTIGAGGRAVEVRSVNGAVSLRKLKADGTVAGNN